MVETGLQLEKIDLHTVCDFSATFHVRIFIVGKGIQKAKRGKVP